MYHPKNILVTGGCGFIGSHLVKKLVKEYPQYNITCIDKLDVCASSKHLEEIKNCSNFKFIKGDICSSDLLNYILLNENIDTVFHVAAQSHVDTSFGNSLSFTKNNVLGTHVLLECCQRNSIKKFVHVSTDEVYGDCNEEKKVETSTTNPTNPYSASKAAAESIVQGYINSFNFPAVITRGNNVYGKGQFLEKLIPKMIMRLKNNMKCCVHGDGSNRRHFLHVSDTVDAFLLVLHYGNVGEIYNIGSEYEFENIRVIKKIINYMKPGDDINDWIEYVQDRPFNDTRYYLNFEKIIKLGWKPQIDFEKGLIETIEWYKNINVEEYWEKDCYLSLDPHPKIYKSKNHSHLQLDRF